MRQTKICLTCNNIYEKNIYVCRNQWSKSKFCSRKCEHVSRKGKHVSLTTEFKKGFRHSLETKKKFAKRIRDKAPAWKGGTTEKNALFRTSKQYLAWRDSIRILYNYTCQICKIRGNKIHVDHIKPFSLYPELRLSLDNGRVLCVDCHKKTPSYLNPHFSKQLINN